MPATVADLLHGLALVVLDETGAPSTTSVERHDGQVVVREPADLPEGRYELHAFGAAHVAAAFRSGLAIAGSNVVEALPSGDPSSVVVLVRFAGDTRPAGFALADAIPLVAHADTTRQIVAGRWSRMKAKLDAASPSPMTLTKSIVVVKEETAEALLRVRYGPWGFHEKRNTDRAGPELLVWMVGDTDDHHLEVRFDGHHVSSIAQEFSAVRDDVTDLAARHGGRVVRGMIVFERPVDPVDFLRTLEPLASSLYAIAEKATSAAVRREVLADRAAVRVLKRMSAGATLTTAGKPAVVDADGRRSAVTYTLLQRMRQAGLVRSETGDGDVFLLSSDHPR